MKELDDQFFVSGVNHIFYHGCCYSPDDVAWPGWCFYASTEMNPRNSIWHDVSILNAYVARCQSVLQLGEPDNDVLLYWPIHDLWHSSDVIGERLEVGAPPAWLAQQPIGKTAAHLWERGFGFDYVSDRELASTNCVDGKLKTPGAEYRVVVAPPVVHMPVETLRQLLKLAEGGATVIFESDLPQDVPGFAEAQERREAMKAAEAAIQFSSPTNNGLREARIGKGRVLVGDLEAALAAAQVAREPIVDQAGVTMIRRRQGTSRHYFIVNSSAKAVDGWFALARPAAGVVAMNPMTGQVGRVNQRTVSGNAEVYLYLDPGDSIILRTVEADLSVAASYEFAKPAETVAELKGPWEVQFTEGGPVLPKGYRQETLAPWTSAPEPDAERFAGTAVYRTTFDAPARRDDLMLDLGDVYQSARVRLNGKAIGAAIMPPYRLLLPAGALQAGGNMLEVEVTNLSANRIRDLDRRHVEWKVFGDINIVSPDYHPLDASNWPVFPSGLAGPVKLLGRAP